MAIDGLFLAWASPINDKILVPVTAEPPSSESRERAATNDERPALPAAPSGFDSSTVCCSHPHWLLADRVSSYRH